ncbi:DUF1146 domain-containing protein [Enterococcus sp. BWB1-3]|uniref:DUF1146 family protein n=1 Tax=unclassified Enterococcus TaxID=2608891 RepID=UPI0019237AC9|nr:MULTISPECIES: DUF1146 family protein [unclassified Enterococcus]MBL1228048.1 DUF1146 domain-containing protein [Enterococcus sp. BWB1-3]MCB5951874.1 DUF1146 family protein [Enterococcus sp. BWT-B8]
MQFYGIDAIIRIASHVLFIYLSFWAFQAVRIDQFFKSLHVAQIRVLIILFSIVLGYTSSAFFLEFIALCRNIFISFFS